MSPTGTALEAVEEKRLPEAPQQQGPPDFEQTVRVVLTTFAVFTGYAIGKAVESVATKIAIPPWDDSLANPFVALVTLACHVVEEPYFWALIALLALLLRYLIGSAIHLNDTYVKRVDKPGDPVSRRFDLLFKDLAFLVAFGLAALLIAKTVTADLFFDVRGFAFGSMVFLAGGLTWTIVDVFIRRHIGKTDANEWRSSVYGWWWVQDLGQLALTGLWIWAVPAICDAVVQIGVLPQIVVLAIINVSFLYLDINGLINGLRPKTRPPAKLKLAGVVELSVDAPAVDQSTIDAGAFVLRDAELRRAISLDRANGRDIDRELALEVFTVMSDRVRAKAVK